MVNKNDSKDAEKQASQMTSLAESWKQQLQPNSMTSGYAQTTGYCQPYPYSTAYNFCPTCGRRFSPDWNYCAGCGIARQASPSYSGPFYQPYTYAGQLGAQTTYTGKIDNQLGYATFAPTVSGLKAKDANSA